MTARPLRSVVAALGLLTLAAAWAFAAKTAPPKLRERGVALGALVEKASSRFGQRMWVSPSVAEEKVTVIIPAATAAKLVRALDVLPGYQWLECASLQGEFRVLGPDWGERAAWESTDLADRAKQAKAAEEAKRRSTAQRLSRHFEALAYSDAQLQALGDDDPWLVLSLLRPQSRLALAYLGQLTPAQVAPLLAGPEGSLRVPFRILPPDLQMALAAWLRSQAANGQWNPTSQIGDLDRMLLERGVISYRNNAMRILTCDVEFPSVRADGGWEGLGMALIIPTDDPLLADEGKGPESGRFLLRLQRGMSRHDASELARKEDPTYREKERAAAERERLARLAADPPRFGDEPPPAASLDTPLSGSTGYAALENLCDQMKAALVCHYFDRCDKTLTDGFDEGTPVDAVLDRLADRVGLIWAYSDGTVAVTSKGLARDLAAEIPSDLLAKWRARAIAAAAAGGRLTLDDLAEMSTDLSDEQARSASDVLRGAGALAWNLPHLRFYGSLDRGQRAAAWSKDGLAYASLRPSQQALFDKAAQAVSDPRQRQAGGAPKCFRVAPREGMVCFAYEFSGAPPREEPVVPEFQAQYLTGPAEPQAPKAAPPLPDQPRGLAAALVLARWAFVQRDVTIEGDPVVTVRTGRGDQARECLVHVGDELEGAVLARVESDPDRLVFRAGEVQITLPKSRAVSLAPWKVSAAP